MNKIIALVILYNKKPQDSLTLLSLLKQHSVNCLCVWNNGPTVVSEDLMIKNLKKNINNVILINKPNNYPLSIVYNWFLHKYDSDYYILLDDDSILDDSYLDAIKNINANITNFDLILPRIKQNNKIHEPKENNQVVLFDTSLNYKHCMSIGSGLILNKHIIKIFESKFKTVFDERFALYGVDTTFFYRLSRLNENICVGCLGDLSHSLSRLDPNENNNLFRFKERSFDLALCARNYPNFITIRRIIKRLLIILFCRRNFKLFFIVIKCFLLGTHPRCRVKTKLINKL